MNSCTSHTHMGDYGIRTPAQFDAMKRGSRLSVTSSGGKEPDTDIYYLLHLGDKDGDLMGAVSLMQRAASTPPDTGWILLEDFHEKGYATEAATELLRFSKEDLGIKELITWPGALNRQSQRVAQKLGFVEGGQVKDKEGNLNLVYILPGMKFDKNMLLSIWGDGNR
ncbi:hypothetical protein MMC25_002964 [Agyrium rufum]|nr:hypothetical protein [Agyrium rufum]